MGHSASVEQSCVGPAGPPPMHIAAHSPEGGVPAPLKTRQHTSPFPQFAALVHSSESPWHGAAVSIHICPAMFAQHFCVAGSHIEAPQTMPLPPPPVPPEPIMVDPPCPP